MATENKKFIGIVVDDNNNIVKNEMPFTGWYSRSMGVCVVITNESHTRFVMEQRGPGSPDFIGKWCFPCGYLNWDETLINAAQREVYEETGIFVTAHDIKFWAINDSPTENRQNVTVRFICVLPDERLDAIAETFKNTESTDAKNRGGENNEISALKIFHKNEIQDSPDMFAFNHYTLLHEVINNQTAVNVFAV